VYLESPSLFTIAIKVAMLVSTGSSRSESSSLRHLPCPTARLFTRTQPYEFVFFAGTRRKILCRLPGECPGLSTSGAIRLKRNSGLITKTAMANTRWERAPTMLMWQKVGGNRAAWNVSLLPE
jgi:hypothetical protein